MSILDKIRTWFTENLLKNRNLKQTILKNSFWLSIGEGLSRGTIILLAIIAARYLGATDYGKFSFAFNYTALFMVLADFGLSLFIVREVAKERKVKQSLFSNSCLLKVLLGIATIAVIAFSTLFMGKSTEVLVTVILFGTFVVFEQFNLFLFAIFKGLEKMEVLAKISAMKSIFLFSTVLFLLITGQGIVELAIAYAVIEGLTGIINFFITRKRFVKANHKRHKIKLLPLLKRSWPFALGIIFTLIYIRIDSVMLSFIKGDVAVGIYAAAYNLLFIFQGAVSLLPEVVKPRFSFLFHRNWFRKYRRLIKGVAGKSVIILIPVIIILSLLSKNILYLIYGSDYVQGYAALIILFVTGAVSFYGMLWGNSLLMSHKQKKWMLAVGLGAGLNILLNFLLIAPYGIEGAATATLLTEIFVFILVYLLNDKRVRLDVIKSEKELKLNQGHQIQ
jgi:O-antigen/teichoic acid export membrane protein